jgi:hypothetical protein
MSWPAAAQETGHWHGLAALVSTDLKTFKLDDQPNHVVMVNDEDGAIHNADGKPFLDKARYQVLALTDSAVGTHGYKTFTEADGTKAFATFKVTEFKPPVINGTIEFTGGTGKYAGITGKGTFHLVRVSDKAAWDELIADYTIPKQPSN